MSAVTRAEFARLMGVNKSTVTRWAEKGQIVVESGQVNVEASRQRLAETSGARPDVAERHAAERGAALKVGDGGTAPTAPQQADDRVGNSYQAARAVKEKYNALQAKLEYERQMGNLIPKEDVTFALNAFSSSSRARNSVAADQLTPILAPITDMDETHAILSEFFRSLDAAIADDLQRMEHAEK